MKQIVLFLTLVFSVALSAQNSYNLVQPTDSTYRVDVIKQNGDGIEYKIPGIEVDSATLVNIAMQDIQQNFEREGLRMRQAQVHNLDARRLTALLIKDLNVNYYAANNINEQFQGDWIFRNSDGKRTLFELKGVRLSDLESEVPPAEQPRIRFKSRTAFTTIGLLGKDDLIEWYLDTNQSERLRFFAETEAGRPVLTKR